MNPRLEAFWNKSEFCPSYPTGLKKSLILSVSICKKFGFVSLKKILNSKKADLNKIGLTNKDIQQVLNEYKKSPEDALKKLDSLIDLKEKEATTIETKEDKQNLINTIKRESKAANDAIVSFKKNKVSWQRK